MFNEIRLLPYDGRRHPSYHCYHPLYWRKDPISSLVIAYLPAENNQYVDSLQKNISDIYAGTQTHVA